MSTVLSHPFSYKKVKIKEISIERFKYWEPISYCQNQRAMFNQSSVCNQCPVTKSCKHEGSLTALPEHVM